MTNEAALPEDVSSEAVSAEAGSPAITFRCPPELEAILPRPIPAVSGLPDWFKSMPAAAFSEITQAEQMTVPTGSQAAAAPQTGGAASNKP